VRSKFVEEHMIPALERTYGFEPAPAGADIRALETPFPLVDVDIAERNLSSLQDSCKARGLANRPHIKTHKAPYWALRQLALGAVGLTCQTLREAEVMGDAGVRDILIPYNIVGERKLARLAALARRAAIATGADSAIVVAGLSAAATAVEATLDVLVECDTGLGRCGVKSPEAALSLAATIATTPGLRFGGFFTYPAPGSRLASAEFLSRAKALCEAQGLPVKIVSSGGTPDLGSDAGLDAITEYRAGTTIYNDRSLIARGACAEADCALSVLATVVSRQSPGRAIVDAGSKALTTDLLGFSDYGLVRNHPNLRISRLDEEHGYLDQAEGKLKLEVGDRVEIIPNHACVVSNLFDRVALVRGTELLGFVRVEARGRVDWANAGDLLRDANPAA
jgi:D-serine deaminase-like pyridoxal phosphate-dependent protein